MNIISLDSYKSDIVFREHASAGCCILLQAVQVERLFSSLVYGTFNNKLSLYLLCNNNLSALLKRILLFYLLSLYIISSAWHIRITAAQPFSLCILII